MIDQMMLANGARHYKLTLHNTALAIGAYIARKNILAFSSYVNKKH